MRSLMTVLGLFGCVQVIQAQDHHAVDKPINELNLFDIRTMPYEMVKSLFHELPPPSTHLEGECLCDMLDSGSDYDNFAGYVGFYNPEFTGFWIGKSFMVDEGWGYNLFMVNSKLVRKYKMAISLTQSKWDDKPSLVLDYANQPNLMGRVHMRDELREVKPGLWLGFGAFGFTDSMRNKPMPFVCTGPWLAPQPHQFTDINQNIPVGFQMNKEIKADGGKEGEEEDGADLESLLAQVGQGEKRRLRNYK